MLLFLYIIERMYACGLAFNVVAFFIMNILMLILNQNLSLVWLESMLYIPLHPLQGDCTRTCPYTLMGGKLGFISHYITYRVTVPRHVHIHVLSWEESSINRTTCLHGQLWTTLNIYSSKFPGRGLEPTHWSHNSIRMS